MKKNFVLDTNILITNPKCITESFEDNDIIIPLTVIEELDNLKNKDGVGYYAREALRNIERIRGESDISKGIERNKGGGLLKIVTIRNKLDQLGETAKVLGIDLPDNRIILTALYIRDQYTDRKTILISNDCNARIKASFLDLLAQRYKDNVVPEEYLTYTGIRTIHMPIDYFGTIKDDEFFPNPVPQEIGMKDFLDHNIHENEFVLFELSPEDQKSHKLGKKQLKMIKGVYRRKDNILKLCDLDGHVYGNIKGRNLEQSSAMNLLLDPDVQIITLKGPAGTGKTIASLACALDQVLEQRMYDKIVFLKPIVTAHEEIGYLKGSMVEKLQPYMGSFIDNINVLKKHQTVSTKETNNNDFEKMLKDGVIEVENIGFLRGRSISDSIIILDEAQNISKSVAKTVVSRVGVNSKIIILGDDSQIDAKHLSREDNGLSHIINKLRGESVYGHITLEKCERSRVSQLAGQKL